MVTLQSAESVLKTVYLDVVSNQLNTEINPFLAKIKQSTEDVWGKEVRKLAPFGINGGIGAGEEDGDLPSAYGNQYVQFVSALKNLYGQIEISDKAIRASSNSVGAFVNLLNAEMEGLLKASAFNLGRMLYGDGSGLVAQVLEEGTGSCVVDSVKNLIEGLAVDIYLDDAKILSAQRIISIDRDTKTVYFSNAQLEIPTASKMYVQGSYNNELTGLGAIFSDSDTLYGVDRNIHKWMKPYIKAVDDDITEIIMQQAIDRLEEVNGSKVDFIVCSAGVKRNYQEYMLSFKRNIDVMELSGGYKALTFNGIPLISDRFVNEGEMYLLNSSEFKLHQLCDWKWLENEQGKILRQTPGKPTYAATLVKYAELVCDKPAGQAKLTGITES
ncbi:MAG TPA: phage major capsid protein [Clostridiales bacterium]|nr:phage major capsid protein [Clostridiales bacterium]